ncbi:MAG: thiol peroxidase [Chromatiales bacterium]|jgi:thiol peroxidase
MAGITFKGQPTRTAGSLPAIGSKAPDFELTGTDLAQYTLGQWSGQRKLLNIFPSVDTPVCAASARRFNEEASRYADTVMLNVSADLPFAQNRYCGSEGLADVRNLSTFRAPEFGVNYGVRIEEGPLRGLCARAIVVIDEHDTVVHTQLVAEIGDEPDYEAALKALG